MEKFTMPARACPHLGGKKCIGEKCAAWDEGPLTEKTAAGPVEKWAAGCVEYFWGPIWQRELVMRMHGAQSGIESIRNNEARIFWPLNRMLGRTYDGDQGKITQSILRDEL